MPVAGEKAILAALRKFAGAVTAKMTTLTAGEPEDQLRAPFETFMQEVGQAIAREIVCTGETRLPGRLDAHEALVDDPQSEIAACPELSEFKVAETIGDPRCRRVAARSDEQRKLGAFERVPVRVEYAAAQASRT